MVPTRPRGTSANPGLRPTGVRIQCPGSYRNEWRVWPRIGPPTLAATAHDRARTTCGSGTSSRKPSRAAWVLSCPSSCPTGLHAGAGRCSGSINGTESRRRVPSATRPVVASASSYEVSTRALGGRPAAGAGTHPLAARGATRRRRGSRLPRTWSGPRSAGMPARRTPSRTGPAACSVRDLPRKGRALLEVA